MIPDDLTLANNPNAYHPYSLYSYYLYFKQSAIAQLPIDSCDKVVITLEEFWHTNNSQGADGWIGHLTWGRGTCRGCSTWAWRCRVPRRCPGCGTCSAPPSGAATSVRSRRTGTPSSPLSAPSPRRRRRRRRRRPRSSELGAAGRGGRGRGGAAAAGGPRRQREAAPGVELGAGAAIAAPRPSSGWMERRMGEGGEVGAGAECGGQIYEPRFGIRFKNLQLGQDKTRNKKDRGEGAN